MFTHSKKRCGDLKILNRVTFYEGSEVVVEESFEERNALESFLGPSHHYNVLSLISYSAAGRDSD